MINQCMNKIWLSLRWTQVDRKPPYVNIPITIRLSTSVPTEKNLPCINTLSRNSPLEKAATCQSVTLSEEISKNSDRVSASHLVRWQSKIHALEHIHENGWNILNELPAKKARHDEGRFSKNILRQSKVVYWRLKIDDWCTHCDYALK